MLVFRFFMAGVFLCGTLARANGGANCVRRLEATETYRQQVANYRTLLENEKPAILRVGVFTGAELEGVLSRLDPAVARENLPYVAQDYGKVMTDQGHAMRFFAMAISLNALAGVAPAAFAKAHFDELVAGLVFCGYLVASVCLVAGLGSVFKPNITGRAIEGVSGFFRWYRSSARAVRQLVKKPEPAVLTLPLVVDVDNGYWAAMALDELALRPHLDTIRRSAPYIFRPNPYAWRLVQAQLDLIWNPDAADGGKLFAAVRVPESERSKVDGLTLPTDTVTTILDNQGF